jgi:hypothetical protein
VPAAKNSLAGVTGNQGAASSAISGRPACGSLGLSILLNPCCGSSKEWSQWPGLNRRPTVYETVALPLSYIGFTRARFASPADGAARRVGRRPALGLPLQRASPRPGTRTHGLILIPVPGSPVKRRVWGKPMRGRGVSGVRWLATAFPWFRATESAGPPAPSRRFARCGRGSSIGRTGLNAPGPTAGRSMPLLSCCAHRAGRWRAPACSSTCPIPPGCAPAPCSRRASDPPAPPGRRR